MLKAVKANQNSKVVDSEDQDNELKHPIKLSRPEGNSGVRL